MRTKLHALFSENEIHAAIEAAVTSSTPGSYPVVAGRERPGKKGNTGRRFNAAASQAAPIDAGKRSGAIRISASDPDALEKLEGRLASMLAMQENMQRTNDFLQNKDRDGLIRYGYSAEGVEELFLCGPGQQLGFSVQEFNNMAMNISRVQDRIVELRRNLVRTTKVVQEQGFQYAEDVDQQRVMFMFPEKPITSVRQLLGKSGFRWSPNRSSWVRPLNANTLQAAETVRAQLRSMEQIYGDNPKITLH